MGVGGYHYECSVVKDATKEQSQVRTKVLSNIVSALTYVLYVADYENIGKGICNLSTPVVFITNVLLQEVTSAVAASQTAYCNNEPLFCPVIQGATRCLDPNKLAVLKVCQYNVL